MATKFEAFNNRGNDYRISHDIEDIICVIDNRTTIVDEVKLADNVVQTFLMEQLKSIKEKGLLDEVLLSHIHPLMLEERMPLVKEKIDSILTF